MASILHIDSSPRCQWSRHGRRGTETGARRSTIQNSRTSWRLVEVMNNIKAKLGTGVFVTCGQNINRGGIFDYWGCPIELAKEVIEEIQELISLGEKMVTNQSPLKLDK
jgi:hypothetical protein